MTDEYELLPADELDRLRREVERLKANPLGGTEKGETLMESVDNLTASVNKLIRVFSDVDQEMVKEYEKVRSVDQELEELKEQNKKIASGILTVAKMVEDGKGSSSGSEGSKGGGWSGDDSRQPPSFPEEAREQERPPRQPDSSQQPQPSQGPSQAPPPPPPNPGSQPGGSQQPPQAPPGPQQAPPPQGGGSGDSEKKDGGMPAPPPPPNKKGLFGLFK